MKHLYKIVYLIVVLASAGLLTCSDSESKLKTLPGGQTAVVISLGLPPENPTAYDNTIWNKIRRIFVRDAMAQTPPATFSSISVTVTGADMAVIQQTFSPGATIQLEVPSGNSRQFAVLATVDPADPSAALSFSGTATANLTEGQTLILSITMVLNETKIVLPDPGPGGTPNRRIIQINNITGSGYTIKTGPNIGFLDSFRPWDIDFDSRGRIYIATNGYSTGEARVIRINNINDTSYTQLYLDSMLYGIASLAVDRTRNYVYFANENMSYPTGLRRCNLDGTGLSGKLAVTGVETILTIKGMDVDTNGILYIAGTSASGSRIFQYDPVAQSVTRIYSSANLNSAEDVKVMTSYVYVTNPQGPNNFKILQLDSNLQFVAGFGSLATVLPNTNPGQFYGPRHFVAIRNDSLIIMDDYNAPTDFDKLVSIRDILGTDWTTFPTTGTGQSEFSFYYGC